MSREVIVAFDDWIHGTSDVYTSAFLEEKLAELEAMSIEAVVEAAGGTTSTTVQIEMSGDGRAWASKNPTAEVNAESTPSGARTVVWGFDVGVRPSADRVRLRIRLGGTGVKARVVVYVRAVSPTRFVPGRVAGCAAWFRGDQGITLVSGAVSSWADLSGNGRDATQATSNKRPSYTASDYFNGLPILTFDGSNDVLATAAFSLGVFSVFMVTSGQSGTAGYFWTRSSAATNADTIYGTTTNTTEVKRGATLSAYNHTGGWGGWGTAAKVMVLRYDGTHAGHTVRLNQAPIATTNVSAGEPGPATTSDQFVIAGRNDSFLPSAINVAEIAVFNRALPISDVLLLEEYARRRYRLAF